MKQIHAYLSFDGNCREAMTFYAGCLGGELYVMPYGDMPPNDAFTVPEGAGARIGHATLTKGSAVLMAADTLPGMPYQRGNDASLYLACESRAEAETLFAALCAGGMATMPLQDTFWGASFGTLTDRFGIQWMLSVG